MQEHLSGDEYEKTQLSRKEKSLGLLCHKFLARYPDYPSTAENNYICLDEVAEELSKLVYMLLCISWYECASKPIIHVSTFLFPKTSNPIVHSCKSYLNPA